MVDRDHEAPKKRVLFICCHNAARSQMAEAFLNARYGERFRAFSAGTEPSEAIDPLAMEAMREIGIDMSKQRTKSVDELIRIQAVFDYVVTVCPKARMTCPYFPAPEQVHVGFDDPEDLEGSEEERMALMRKVRDDIGEWIDRFFGSR